MAGEITAQVRAEPDLDAMNLDHLEGFINTQHEALAGLATTALQRAVLIGKALVAARHQVRHGGWDEWVASRCPFSKRSAQRYMRLAKSTPRVASSPEAALSMTDALAKLAKPSEELEAPAAPKAPAPPPSGPTPEEVDHTADLFPEAEQLEVEPEAETQGTMACASCSPHSAAGVVHHLMADWDCPRGEPHPDAPLRVVEWPEITREEAQRLTWPGPTNVAEHYGWERLAQVFPPQHVTHPGLDFDGLLSRLLTAQACAAFVAELGPERCTEKGQRLADEVDRVLRRCLQLLLGREAEFDLHRADLAR